MPPRPLAGVRVIDLTRLLPGAYATLLMADLGADVVKIEDPRGGDPSRTLPPGAGGTSAYFRVLNRNKRSVTLDLRSRDAASVLDRLVARADIVVESFRPQTARRLGVDAESLGVRHPRLIHASISGFGQTGPSVARAAHDINFEAISGLLKVGEKGTGVVSGPIMSDEIRTENGGKAKSEGERRGRESFSRGGEPFPRVPPMLIADLGAAMHAAAGILAALYQRERTGAGAAVEVSIHEAALSWLLFPAARQLVGDDPEALEMPVRGDHACYNIYRAADGQHLALGALEPKFWRAFCERIGRADLVPLQYVRGPGGPGDSGDAQARLLREVRALIQTRPRDEWLAFFADVDVCLTPVNNVAEALADPHLRARGTIARHGDSTYITTPISIAQPVEVQPAPSLGVHTDQVLEEAGIDAAVRADLRARGII